MSGIAGTPAFDRCGSGLRTASGGGRDLAHFEPAAGNGVRWWQSDSGARHDRPPREGRPAVRVAPWRVPRRWSPRAREPVRRGWHRAADRRAAPPAAAAGTAARHRRPRAARQSHWPGAARVAFCPCASSTSTRSRSRSNPWAGVTVVPTASMHALLHRRDDSQSARRARRKVKSRHWPAAGLPWPGVRTSVPLRWHCPGAAGARRGHWMPGRIRAPGRMRRLQDRRVRTPPSGVRME